jgi:hypothetical protein
MTSFSSAQRQPHGLLGVLSTASLLFALFSPITAIAQAEQAQTSAPAAASERRTSETAKAIKKWREVIAHVPMPKKGCFKASYPSKVWKEVPCVTPPQNPYMPGRGSLPYTIGGYNGVQFNNVSAQVTAQITSATGSFDSMTGVASETGTTFASGCSNPTATSDTFSLQLNTLFFTSSKCQGLGGQCQGWQQFVYSNSYCNNNAATGCTFIQYWLANATTSTIPCPNGWRTAGSSCWKNAVDAVSVPTQSITNLVNMSLTGNASSTGNQAIVTAGGQAYGMNASLGDDLGLAGHWNSAEFGVFGDACDSTATFTPAQNSVAQIVVRTSITDGTQKAPSCVVKGYTGEKNNLSFGPTAPAPSGNPPALLVTQSSAGGLSFCAAATSVGDTHLATFGGLFYDFQASGDFLLVEAERDFVVEARQVSGAPTWPDASTNVAVAAKMGETRVAICLNPDRLVVDGKPENLADGASRSFAGRVDVAHKGNVYLVTDQSGDSLSATLNSNGNNGWIDVAVGLGSSPQSKLRGLLANVPGNVQALSAKDGRVFKMPMSFDDLYHTYADSWRIEPAESLLSVCGDKDVERGVPTKPLFANNLRPDDYKRARAACDAAGIKVKSLLDACTLDVAVIGSSTATEAFVHLPAPVAVGRLRRTVRK